MEGPVGRQIILGETQPNHYSLSVMQRAADELSGESTLKSAVVLQPTHYYCINDKSAEIFCTTIHEIAHPVHHFWNTLKYVIDDKWLKDAWYETTYGECPADAKHTWYD